MIALPSVEAAVTRLRSGRFRLTFEITIGAELARTLSAALLLIGAKLAGDETPGAHPIEIRRFDTGWLVVVPACLAEPSGARRRFPTIEQAREFANYRST